MPPGPAYNWLCVFASTVKVLENAARICAGAPAATALKTPPTRPRSWEQVKNEQNARWGPSSAGTLHKNAVDPGVGSSDAPLDHHLQASSIPTSRVGRLVHYGGLAASLGYGVASEFVRRTTSGQSEDSANNGLVLTEANIKRLVSKLSQMRGAALKVGQFLSIQDTHVLPPELDRVFRLVQDSAHYMPDWQLEKILSAEFPPSTTSPFKSFNRTPLYAASIGQVHQAILSKDAEGNPTGKDVQVAVKVRFPSVRESIHSDLKYIQWLFKAVFPTGVLPKGLFLGKSVEALSQELVEETSYLAEAQHLRLFKRFFEDPRFSVSPTISTSTKPKASFRVPWVWSGSTDSILVMEWMDGISVGKAAERGWDQEDKNEIASMLLRLCLHELFTFRAMQTDPNPSNFLWNPERRELQLVDFGGTRLYEKRFIDMWLRLLQSAARDDTSEIVNQSHLVGYLTGEESQAMLDAHTRSLSLLATPFKGRVVTKQPFAFGPGTQWEAITREVREDLIPVMLRERKCPPPKESYSLNRKLSGIFLIASKLNAKMDTKRIWDEVVGEYVFDDSQA